MRHIFWIALAALSSPALADTNCREQVDAAFAKLRDTKTFRIDTTINNSDGTLKMSADYVLPDRMHQKVTLSGENSGLMEMIVIGQKAWSNQGGGWAELPPKFSETVAKQIKETVAEAPKVMTDYKCLGEKDFEGKKYSVYQGVLATPLASDAKEKGPRISAVDVPNQQSVYIDAQSGLPARNIVTPVTDPQKRLFDGTFTIVRDISIEPPKVAPN